LAVATAFVFGLATIAGPRLIDGPSVAMAQQAPINHGYVIVMRGLMNIWSRGMDKLAKELEARGVNVHLENHRHWRKIAEAVAKKYQADKNTAPIVIVGHSLGANAAVLLASKLGEYRVPVRLIVALDGLSNKTNVEASISYNVEQVLNYYNSLLLGMKMVPGRGFNGSIENVDIRGVKGAGHISVDKNPELQAKTISLIMQVLAK
jgi:pimeloyl-ACP methyl ester carboxylesterase